jgi:hypothetical protein
MLLATMVRTSTPSTSEARRELVHETWSEYLDAVSRELVDAPVSIEVIPRTEPVVVEAPRLALRALAYDRVNDVFELSVVRGGSERPSVRHVIDHPGRIEVDSHTLLAPMTIVVEGENGVRTVITIERDDTPSEFTEPAVGADDSPLTNRPR